MSSFILKYISAMLYKGIKIIKIILDIIAISVIMFLKIKEKT